MAKARMVTGSALRQPPTGSALAAISFRGERLVNARSASNCSPAVVAASAVTINLRRKNRSRRKNHGSTASRIGSATTAIASSTASQLAVVSRS